jgi:hypothetical protein
LLAIQRLIGGVFVYSPIFIGASPEPRRLSKKPDQNFSHRKVFGVTFFQKGNKRILKAMLMIRKGGGMVKGAGQP